jgi:flap endonuclease-1
MITRSIELCDLRGRRLAVDGNGELYQFLALIRQRDGVPLMDGRGRITSHLVGLFYRVTRLLSDAGPGLVFVFDGRPPSLKADEIERRREVRARFERESAEARAAGDVARAYATSTMTSRLTRDMVAEACELLALLGVPVVQAPGEGEAQAAFMAARGDAWAAASKDYDALLFGTTRLLRFLTISGREFLPSKGAFRPLRPEVIEVPDLLARLGISREQLVDLAILVGTDFNAGIKGVGPRKALKLVQAHGSIEAMPEEIRREVANFGEVRRIYLEPDVTAEYRLEPGELDEEGLTHFLCEERGFAPKRVRDAVARVRSARSAVVDPQRNG